WRCNQLCYAGRSGAVALARAFHRPRDRTEKGGRFRLQPGCSTTRRARPRHAGPTAKKRAASTRKFFAWRRQCPAGRRRVEFPESIVEQSSAAEIISA